MRAVLDPNVLISALLSPGGAPARTVAGWLEGRFELVVSEQLIDELERSLAYPKLHARISPEDASEIIALLRDAGTLSEDPGEAPPLRSSDPGDDYLLALAASERAGLVTGDGHLLELSGRLPVYSVEAFLELLDAASS